MVVNKYPTMDDVARYAGVSQTTVSRVLRGLPVVSDKKRVKVNEAVEKLGFKRNIAASKLAGNRSNEIGIIIPDIANPFFAALYKGAESVLVPRGYSIMLGNSGNAESAACNYIDKLLEHRAAGVIVASIDLDPLYVADVKDKLGIVTIPIEIGVDCVTADEERGAIEAIDYLVQKCGHKRIAFWGFDKNFEQISKRYNGYLQGLSRNSIPFEQDLVFISGMFQDDIFEKVAHVMPQLTAPDGPTAIFAFNDNAAINIITALNRHNIQVPRDISIIGFDNTFISNIVSPPLTTVSQPASQMGQVAAELLLDHLENDNQTARTVTLPTEFVLRESVRKITEHTSTDQI